MNKHVENAITAHVRKAMRDEFTKFFVTMTSPSKKGWPKIPDDVFVETLAESLIEMGKQRGLGVALTQTLVHELQDRINFNQK